MSKYIMPILILSLAVAICRDAPGKIEASMAANTDAKGTMESPGGPARMRLDVSGLQPSKVQEGVWSAPSHTLSSERFDIFWGDARSAEPWNDFAESDKKHYFDPRVILQRLEEFWKITVDEMQMFRGDHFMPRDRVRVLVKGTWKAEGSYDNPHWAVGFGVSEGQGDERRVVGGQIGVYPAAAMSEYVMWHELTHVLQAYIRSDLDPAKGPPADARKVFGMSHEAHASFVPVIASGGRHTPKCEAPLLTKHLRPGHRRPYQNWLWMLFVHEKGEESGLFSKVWHGYTAYGLHPFEVIKRKQKLDAAAFADFWFEHALRNVTGDYKIPNVRNAIAAIERGKDRDKLTTRLQPVPGQPGTFTVPAEFVPQRFGYNHILLRPLGGENGEAREIQVELAGGPSQDKSADWRFGFCVIDANGQPRYTKPSAPGQTALVDVAADDSRVYLVVMAATGVIEPFSKDDPDDEEIPRYPYAVRIRGAAPEVTAQASRE